MTTVMVAMTVLQRFYDRCRDSCRDTRDSCHDRCRDTRDSCYDNVTGVLSRVCHECHECCHEHCHIQFWLAGDLQSCGYF